MRFAIVIAVFACHGSFLLAQPQTFSSGSTGADGALTFPPNAGLIYFNPANYAARTNNIYNFTTITVPAGTTVRFSSYLINGPVYWLAQGDITITGTLDLSGKTGHPAGSTSYRAPSDAGAGGYSGGLAAGPYAGQVSTPGNGPGGGAAAGFNTSRPDFGQGGSFSGNSYLVPLIGGSGGGGGCSTSSCGGGGNALGGSAGGGAILIASSTKITVNGLISVAGGDWNGGGGGSGGSVRLVSNQVSGGSIDCRGGQATGIGITGPPFGGSAGLVRVESFSGSVGTSVGCPVLSSVPYNLALPTGGASNISVTSINGTPINANPFTFPDITINTGTAVPITITGSYIPPGTTGKLLIFSETTPDQTISFTLTGTLQSTTATVNVAYPPGGSRGFAKVTWTQ